MLFWGGPSPLAPLQAVNASLLLQSARLGLDADDVVCWVEAEAAQGGRAVGEAERGPDPKDALAGHDVQVVGGQAGGPRRRETGRGRPRLSSLLECCSRSFEEAREPP